MPRPLSRTETELSAWIFTLTSVAWPGERLVDAVVDDLVDHVVQARAVVGVADVHAGTLADGLQPLENLDGIGAVFVGLKRRLSHACPPVFFLPDLIVGQVGNVTRQPQDLAVIAG